jgi:hypothetical protein
MKPLRLVAFALVASLLFHTGCLTPAFSPKAAALARIHEFYSEEFTALAPSGPTGDVTSAAQPAAGDAFAQTLRAIHDYRLAHPNAQQELAHLDVLEGMIYLQSGRFGLAAAVQEKVSAAAPQLASGTGRVVRDRLFAENYRTLLLGWSEARKENGRDWKTFRNAADALAASLDNIPPEQRPAISADGGALYLATTAAIFYVWAGQQMSMAPDPDDRDVAPQKTREWRAKARDLIGKFLTPAETAADISQDIGSTPPQGRLRYIDWYHWLKKNP